MGEVKVTTLSNGLRVAVDEMPEVESASLGIWVACGTRHESAELNGMAHMLEHMAFKGTRTRSARAIAEEIENVGGSLNAYTGREITAYHASVLKEDVGLGIEMIAAKRDVIMKAEDRELFRDAMSKIGLESPRSRMVKSLEEAREAIKYALWGEGFLASTAVPIRMYFRTRPGLETPDATISIAPFLYERVGHERRISARRGITMNVNVLRSESTGSIHIKSADPAAPPAIRFNFLSALADRDDGDYKILQARYGLFLQIHTGGQGGFKAAMDQLGFGDRVSVVKGAAEKVPKELRVMEGATLMGTSHVDSQTRYLALATEIYK